MSTLLLLTAVLAALRGLWSPCGLSMLSSLNPVSERARGHRFWITALWYLAGAVAGGAVLGAGCALVAAGIGRSSLPATVTWSAVLGAALIALASDLHVGGWSLPVHPRQVDERWLTRYRRWIYAGGFGVQIGTGFATYIMTAGVYLLAVLAVLPGDPRLGLLAGVVFALVRGAGIGLAATARDPERLQRVMARVDAAGAAAGWLAGPATGAVVAATLAGATLARGGLVRRTVAAS